MEFPIVSPHNHLLIFYVSSSCLLLPLTQGIDPRLLTLDVMGGDLKSPRKDKGNPEWGEGVGMDPLTMNEPGRGQAIRDGHQNLLNSKRKSAILILLFIILTCFC